MSNQLVPADIESLRLRTREFIRATVIPSESCPGKRLEQATWDRLQAAAVFAPHVPKEFGAQGVPIQYWSPIFQEPGYSAIGPSALNCMAPHNGNMHMLNLIATDSQKERYLARLAAGTSPSCFEMTEPHPRRF